MKNELNTTKLIQLLFIALISVFSFTACDDNPDKYEMTDGIPEVYYVRVPSPAFADLLLVQLS